MDKLEFELTLKKQEVMLDGKEYVLKELDGRQKGKYLNTMGSRVVLNDEGKVAGFRDYNGLESSLLSLCLYCDDKPVPAATIDSWPSTVLGRLFDAAQELSGLNEEGRKRLEAEAKNS